MPLWLTLLLPILSAGLAAVITHALTRRRAVEDARRELRLTYLVEAYRHIERASNRRLTPEVSRELEAAVGDVFLLGTDEQTMLARDFCESMATGGGGDTGPLLAALRSDLREELRLGPIGGSPLHLRVTEPFPTESPR